MRPCGGCLPDGGERTPAIEGFRREIRGYRLRPVPASCLIPTADEPPASGMLPLAGEVVFPLYLHNLSFDPVGLKTAGVCANLPSVKQAELVSLTALGESGFPPLFRLENLPLSLASVMR